MAINMVSTTLMRPRQGLLCIRQRGLLPHILHHGAPMRMLSISKTDPETPTAPCKDDLPPLNVFVPPSGPEQQPNQQPPPEIKPTNVPEELPHPARESEPDVLPQPEIQQPSTPQPEIPVPEQPPQRNEPDPRPM